MADKIPNEPSCSKYEAIDTELNTGKNRKRELSISESEYEYEYNDQTDCETSTNKRSLYKSNALWKRTSEQSLSDVIQKLTQQIEHIENNFAKYQNFTKNTEVNDISCDDELIYQPPNKIIKYDNEIISADYRNSDENNIGSTNKINTTKHVNKKIKLDKNILFQKDVGDSERDSKSLTNEEVEMLLELSYKIDDEDNTPIKTHNFQTNEDSDTVSFPDQEDKFNTSVEHVINESMLDYNKISFSTEDQSMAQSNDCSKRSMNQNDVFVNVGETFVPEMCNANVDNSIDQEVFDFTKFDNDEIILDHENVTCKSNLEQKNKGTLKILTIEEEKTLTKLVNNEDDELGIVTDCTDKTTVSQTSEDYIYKNISRKRKNQDDLLVVTMRTSDENVRMSNERKSMSQSDDDSDSIMNQSDVFVNVGEILVFEMCDDNVDNSIDHDDFLDMTKCDNDELLFDHENFTSATKEDINCTTPFNYVNSEIQTDSEQKTQYSGDSIHETDIERMIVQESKSCESTINVDGRETVCETLNDQEGNIFEPSDAVDDSHDVNILEAVHPKVIDCENNFNQKDLLDINEYVNEEIMLENENVTCKLNLEQKNKGTLKIITIEEEETLSKLVNNKDDELEIVTYCTDKTAVPQTCEDYIYENISKKKKNQDDLLVVSTRVSDENVSMIIEGKSRSDQTDQPTKSINQGVDGTIFNNKEIDNLTERQFTNDGIFVMPAEVTDGINYNSLSPNCCCSMDDTAIDNFEVSINERNSQSLVNGDQFISNTFYFGSENCRDVSVHTIHSLDAYEMNNSLRNNTTVHSMENNDSLVSLNKEIENSIVELYCNSDNKTLSGIKNKSYSNEEESAGGIMKHTTENIAVSLESSNSYLHGLINLSKSVNDFENILEPVDESSMNCKSITTHSNTNPLYELQRTVSEIYEYNNNTIIDQEDFFDLTKCDNDEIILDQENCTSVTKEDIHFTTPFNYVNSEIQTDSEQKTQYSGDSIHETDIGRMIVQERKSCESTINVDGRETVCETLKDQEGNIFEPSDAVDDSHDVNILEAVHPKVIDQEDVFDLTKCDNDKIILDHENVTCKSNLEQKNKGTLKILTIEEEKTLTKLVNNEDEELGIVTDCTDKTTVSQTSEDYIYKNITRKRKNQDDLLVVTTLVSDENISIGNERKSMSQNDDDSDSIMNQSDVFVNVGEILVSEMCDDNVDNSIDHDDFLDMTKCDNDEIILEHENFTSVTNEDIHFTTPFNYVNSEIQTDSEQKIQYSGDSIHETDIERMIVQESKSCKSTINVDDQETVCETLNDQEGNIFEPSDAVDDSHDVNILEAVHPKVIDCENNFNQKDFLDINEYVNEEIMLENENVTCKLNLEQKIKGSVSFNSNDARQILESSNDDSEHFDDSLLFKPSDRDLLRYGIECEAYEKTISQSLNNLENNVSNKEVIPQCNTLKSINNLVSSSYVKDYEDNVIDFYDCELSSIENSDVEDNQLLSFEKDTSIDDCIFENNQNKLKNATNFTSDEQTCDTNLKISNLGSPKSCNNLTNVVSLIHSPSHDHQYNEIISKSISKTEMQMNPDADDKLESLNSNNTITSCNAISSFKDSDDINNIQSNNLGIDQGNFNENQNLEDSIKSHDQNNENKSISGSNTHQNIKKSQKSYGNNETETESSMKITGNCTIPKSNNEEIPKMNTVQSSGSVIDQNEIDKKKYLDEIIKNEQLFNKFDEKLDVNESAAISPFISQSLAKSSNLKNALAKKAAAHINIHDMGDKALSTYLTQQTMTLDVLEVLHKSLDTCPSSGILMEDPEGLVVSLMPHQKHAIAWLIWRESQEPHGGILADDMGLGKTLSMISLILKSKEKQQDCLLPVVSIDNGRNDVIIGGTLVICPASLINQWETEVKTKLKPGLLKVVQYYGMNRSFSALELAKNDLVITSYNIVMWDQKKKQNTSPLYRIKWDRIILDEGHNIRNHKTQTSVAVCNIKSLNRWAITGTPIHNKEADFFTLLKFVRCKPFDDWAVWKRWVGNNDDAGKHRLSLLVKTLMLRRTKSELTQFTTFNLPKKEINTIEIELSKEERNAYEKLLQFSSNLFATYLYDRVAKEKVFDPSITVQCKVQYFQEPNQDKDEVFKDHPELLKLFRQFKNIDEIQTYHILVLLLRLRQICCHPTLIKGPITEESIKQEDNMESIPEDDTDVFNNDSYNENTDIDTFPNNIDLSELMSCLTLKDEPVKKKPVIESNIFQKSWISTKVKIICDLVNQKVLIDGNREKAIIVSQWPSYLYLIRKHLAHYNAKMEMFSGTIPIPKRNKIIREFNQPNSGPQILLLSLKAGGVGLNLMAANHMFLVDIHWNPQLEAQACDRVYRVGQTKPVYVYKFICSNTIETRIMNIQTHKLQMADNLFKGTSITSKITIDDLKQIFQFH